MTDLAAQRPLCCRATSMSRIPEVHDLIDGRTPDPRFLRERQRSQRALASLLER